MRKALPFFLAVLLTLGACAPSAPSNADPTPAPPATATQDPVTSPASVSAPDSLNEEEQIEAVKTYFAQNSTPVDLDTTPHIQQLNFADLDQYDVFLSGESHDIAQYKNLNAGLIRYFHEQAGVKLHLSEIGFGAGILLQEYLDTGDEALLDMLMDELKGTSARNKEYREFWTWLRSYNQPLPQENRVRLFGVDVDHQRRVAVQALRILTKKTGANPTDMPALQALLEGSLPANEEVYGLFEQLAAEVKQQEEGYQGLFKDSYGYLTQLIASVAAAKEYYATDSTDIRDAAMMDRFLFIRSLFPNQKMYGHFGGAHINRRELTNHPVKETLAMRLEFDTSPVKGRVCSIYGVPLSQLSDSSWFKQEAVKLCGGKDLFASLTNAEGLLNNPEFFFGNNHTGGVTTDYIQKLVFIDQPTEVTPY